MIQVEDDKSGEQVRQLYRWLGRDTRLARQATIGAVETEARSDQMSGGSLELINLILSNSIALGSLATSIITFCRTLRSHRRAEPVVVVLREGEAPVRISGTSDVTEVIAALRKEPDPDSPSEVASADGYTS